MIVIDPGHGGADPGAISGDIVEKDYALKISQYQFNRFRELGVPVTMTRTTDETLTPTERVRRVLDAYGNRPDVIVLSNHLNATGGQGAEVIYALRNNDRLSMLILNEIAKEGQVIRKAYQRRLPSDTSKDYYFIHRNTGVTEPVLIEYAFVDGPLTDKEQIRNNWRNLAEAVVRAVSIYRGIPYDLILDEGIYVVEAGDTLYSIARRFNVSIDAIKEANNLVSDTLRIGQRLYIPGLAPPPLTDITYIVQSGDTLYSIARAYDTTVAEIMALNNLTTTTLRIGQVLQIPTIEIPITPPTEPPPPPSMYTVRVGDTLFSIARQFGTTAQKLKEVNNLTTDFIVPGQVLQLPEPPPPPIVPEEPIEPPTITYTVKAGDNLYSVAREYGTTVTEIMEINNLTTTLLSIGQVLKIPTGVDTTPDIITYTVKAGDNLYSIARQYGTTVTEIMTLNNLTTTLLSIGQILQIPVGNREEQREVLFPDLIGPISPLEDIIGYTVRRGDTLTNIANRYGTTVEQIKRLNNLVTDVILVGQSLLIPIGEINDNESSKPTKRIYKVEKGDTLWGIARKYGTKIDEIKQSNKLISDNLKIGQELIIPITLPVTIPEGTSIYIVQRGDTLWSIAQKYKTSVSVLRTLNDIEDDIINVGQTLFVPLVEDDIREIELDVLDIPIIVRYTVQRGDTLTSIVNRYGTTVDTIMRINNLESDFLRVGQELFVPRTPIEEVIPVEPTVALYNVKKGDTLWSIARRFGTTVSILKTLNNLSSNLIKIDQELMVPITPPITPPEGTTLFIVKKGDTLSSIAKAFETSVSAIKEINKLETDLIRTGQILLVPKE